MARSPAQPCCPPPPSPGKTRERCMPGPVVPLPPRIPPPPHPAFPDAGCGVWCWEEVLCLGVCCCVPARLQIARVIGEVSGTRGARQLDLGQNNHWYFRASSAESRIVKSQPGSHAHTCVGDLDKSPGAQPLPGPEMHCRSWNLKCSPNVHVASSSLSNVLVISTRKGQFPFYPPLLSLNFSTS